ncbi:SagB/ThcOx family dehydrogenase [Natrinema salsiterrestre]|uniref:SagB/ThcOx family dehydrogenase n=1 Tax=Natrinema salsiterrestre TaxID=2950540 RepID=A0A9Q4L6J4_9EURY|nr:SagB/ThcOx family dehydrogenase [Natrinema salsiterrestre]MDF9747477.1 SagB/ThcOx family dehydrogenase [Natrinema salsiterrestre]
MEQTSIVQDLKNISLELNRHTIRTDNYFQDFSRKENLVGDISEIFHENTKVQQVNPKFVRSIEHFSQISEKNNGIYNPSAKRVDRPLIDLPEPEPLEHSLSDVINARQSVRTFKRDPITAESLSRVLWYGCGPVGDTLASVNDVEVRGRGYPSAGGLYPVEPYVILLDGDDLNTGVYYYEASEHGLRTVKQMERGELVEHVQTFTGGDTLSFDRVSVLFVLTGSFWKNKIKYGPRGYRFTLLEAGHLAQNLQLVATALGYGTCNSGGLDESRVDPFLGVNGVDESTIYGILFGTPASGGDDNGN